LRCSALHCITFYIHYIHYIPYIDCIYIAYKSNFRLMERCSSSYENSQKGEKIREERVSRKKIRERN
jgi:hypothetical protein